MEFIRKNKNNTYSVRVDVVINKKGKLSDKTLVLGSYKKLEDAKSIAKFASDIINESDVYNNIGQYEIILPNILSDKKAFETASKSLKKLYRCYIDKNEWEDYGL